MAAPTLVFFQATAGNGTGSLTTTAFTANANDVLIIETVDAGGTANDTITAPTTTYTVNAITARQTIGAGNPATKCSGGLYSATITAGGSGTVTIPATSGTQQHVAHVWIWRNGTEPTTARTTSQATASRTVPYTASQADSAICWTVADFAAAAVQAETPTGTSHNSSTPGPSALSTSGTSATQYTWNGADIDDQTLTSSVNYGIGGSGTGPFTILVAEVQGTGGAAAPSLVGSSRRRARPTIGKRRPVARFIPQQALAPATARASRRPTMRARRRPVEVVPPQVVVTPPALVPDNRAHRPRWWALRRGKAPEVVPPQVVVAAPAWVPSPARRGLKGWLTTRRHQAEVPAQQASAVLRAGRRSSWLSRRRRLPVEVVPPQVVVAPPVLVPDDRAHRPRWWALRRGKAREVVPPQVVVPPPPFVNDDGRRAVHGFTRSRRRPVEVVPAQVVIPPPPFLPESRRRQARGLVARRRRVELAPGQVLPSPTSARRALRVVGRRRLPGQALPPQSSPPPGQQQRHPVRALVRRIRAFVGVPLVGGTPQVNLIPEVILTAPVRTRQLTASTQPRALGAPLATRQLSAGVSTRLLSAAPQTREVFDGN